MIVRSARHDDIPRLAKVAARSFQTAFSQILEPDALALRGEEYFEQRFATDWPRTRVASDNGNIVGFCTVTAGHIDMIFVDPAVQSHGAGSALFADAEGEGARTLECFRDNTFARAFYERRGWVCIREYTREFLGRERAFVFYAAPSAGTVPPSITSRGRP